MKVYTFELKQVVTIAAESEEEARAVMEERFGIFESDFNLTDMRDA